VEDAGEIGSVAAAALQGQVDSLADYTHELDVLDLRQGHGISSQ
jgi:hypothetical protein